MNITGVWVWAVLKTLPEKQEFKVNEGGKLWVKGECEYGLFVCKTDCPEKRVFSRRLFQPDKKVLIFIKGRLMETIHLYEMESFDYPVLKSHLQELKNIHAGKS